MAYKNQKKQKAHVRAIHSPLKRARISKEKAKSKEAMINEFKKILGLE